MWQVNTLYSRSIGSSTEKCYNRLKTYERKILMAKRNIDFTGIKFGKWLVLRKNEEKTNTTLKAHYECQCECGKLLTIKGSELKTGRTTQCKSCSKTKDLTGQRFNKLVVIKFIKPKNGNRSICVCQCDCGNIKVIQADTIKSGHTKSCGCLQVETARQMGINNTKHGMSYTKIYAAYRSIIQRCYNTNNAEFHNYGERGIVMCSGWLENFDNFYKQMGDKPEGLSIDRIDNNLNYSCGKCSECIENGWKMNCRWATQKQQLNNIRRNTKLTINKVTQTLSEWSEAYNINNTTISERLKRGWDVESAVTQPINIQYRKNK